MLVAVPVIVVVVVHVYVAVPSGVMVGPAAAPLSWMCGLAHSHRGRDQRSAATHCGTPARRSAPVAPMMSFPHRAHCDRLAA